MSDRGTQYGVWAATALAGLALGLVTIAPAAQAATTPCAAKTTTMSSGLKIKTLCSATAVVKYSGKTRRLPTGECKISRYGIGLSMQDRTIKVTATVGDLFGGSMSIPGGLRQSVDYSDQSFFGVAGVSVSTKSLGTALKYFELKPGLRSGSFSAKVVGQPSSSPWADTVFRISFSCR